jgi:hypothetical protein
LFDIFKIIEMAENSIFSKNVDERLNRINCVLNRLFLQISIPDEAHPDYCFLQPDGSGNLYYLTNSLQQQNTGKNLTVVNNNVKHKLALSNNFVKIEIIGYHNDYYAIHFQRTYFPKYMCGVETYKFNKEGRVSWIPTVECRQDDDDIQISNNRIGSMGVNKYFYPDQIEVHDVFVSDFPCRTYGLRCGSQLGFQNISNFLLLENCILVESQSKLCVAKFYA